VLAVLGGAALTLSWGVTFGANQFQYLLLGLRLGDPQFLPGDWFTWATHHHHFIFGYLTWLLDAVGPPQVTLLAAQGATMVIFAAGLLVLSKSVTRHGRLTFGLSLLVVALYPPEHLLIAVAGMFHGSFLASFFPVAGVQGLACGAWRHKRDLVAFFGPLVIAGLVFTALVAVSGGLGQADAESMRIMTRFRSAHHYDVAHWGRMAGIWLPLWLAWAVAAILALVSDPRRGWRDPAVISFGAAATITGLSVLMTALDIGPALIALGLWRVAPWLHYLGLVLVAGRLLDRVLPDPDRPEPWRATDIAFVAWLAGVVLLWAYATWQAALVLLPVALLAVVHRRAGRAGDRPRLRARPVALGVIGALVAVAAAVGAVRRTFNDMQAPVANASVASLQEWVLTETAPDTLFVVPPGLKMFRLMMRRPIVVDLKCAPYHPVDLRAWHQRVLDVSGIERTAPPEAAPGGYALLDTQRARMLHEKYGATHFVVRRLFHRGDLDGMRVVFQNDRFLVLTLPDEPPDSG
jgi:hypothetical protein